MNSAYKVRSVISVVSVIIIMLGVVTVALLLEQADATDALRTSSSRSECRTRITNEQEDMFRRSVGELLAAIVEDDDRTVVRVVVEMRDRPAVQTLIEAECPKPLVSP